MLFDEGAGFETTSLATTAVKVQATDGSKEKAAQESTGAKTPKTGADSKASTDSKASASATPKTGDFTAFAIAGIAIVALLAVGGLALSLARRRR